jgi:glycosyltransferase involved in cell wall biosynthesis
MDIPADGAMGEILSRYDAAVFNLGNNVQNHALITAALRRVPGIAVLHDFSYHHFFAHKCFDDLRSPPAYARLMHDYYGSAGFNMALRSGVITRDTTLYAPWDGENVAEHPLMQPLAMLAAAIVVHSQFMEEKVAKFFKGPVLRLFLPSDQKVAPSPADIARWHSETAGKERCQFATFGHIGRPKCLDVIVLAISQSPILRARANLVIAGHPGDKEYTREIEALVATLGLTKQVTFEYSVTNERLLEIKNESDVFLNLRYPNTEGASGSLIEMMNAARPVIAYRAGCYAEVPTGAAVLVDRTSGIESVIRAMEDLVTDPERRIAIGTAARDHVRENDSAKYARELKAFISNVQDDLRLRSRLVAPVRDAMSWQASDVTSDDAGWFADLTRARRSLLMLERDSAGQSPEIFLDWAMDDLIAFVGRVLLHANVRDGLNSLLVEYAQRLGRWPFYRLISRIFRRQSLCQQPEISKDNVALYGERVTDTAFWDIAARLQPEIFVRLLYLCVLERGWGPGEQDNWVKRIRQGMPPSQALLEFLGSVEYQQAFSDGLMQDVEDWGRRESAFSKGRRSAPRAQIVWPAETSFRFSEDNPEIEALFGQLWHQRDAQGRWSDGRVGDLLFLMPEDVAKVDATLTLRIRVAGTRITGQRKITAHCNRRELASLMVRDDAPLNWQIPLPASVYSKDGINLLLMADQDFSPAAGGQSRDKRSLGIMLIEGRLSVGVDGGEPGAVELAQKGEAVSPAKP